MRGSSDLFTSVLLYSTVLITISSSKDCLSDVSITEINSEQANLTWNFDCKESEIRSFKIFYDHIDYKACSDEVNRLKPHPKKTAGSLKPYNRWKVIGQLLPFSGYEFIVRPIFNDRTHAQEKIAVRGITEREPPSVKVRVQASDSDTNQIKFILAGVDLNQCDQFNAHLGYVRYHVKGQDSWNKDFELMDHVSWDSKEIVVGNLLPNSRYGLALFVTDKDGNYNADGGSDFDFTATTRQSPPTAPPSHVRLAVHGAECSVVWRDAYPPVGEADYYILSSKQDGGEWKTDRIEAREVQTLRTEGGKEENSYMLPLISDGSTISVKIRSFNKGFSDGSAWSEEVSNANDNIQLAIIVGLALAGLILSVFFTIWLKRCMRVRRYEAAKTDDYSQRPIIRELDPRGLDSSSNVNGSRQNSLRPPSLAASVASSSPGTEVELRRGGQGKRGSRGRSLLDPLPPVPGEPLYEPLRFSEEPPLDEEQYLVPNPAKVASVESLDEEGYLKPNFHRIQPFNTKSPTRESPEPIPMVSYSSQDELERDKV